jgi:hypothetical protein
MENEQVEKTALEIAAEEALAAKKQLEEERSNFEKERKALLKKVLDGGKVVEKKELTPEEIRSRMADLRVKLSRQSNTNLDVISAALELRDLNLQLTGKDDFELKDPNGNIVNRGQGERVAEGFRHMIEQSNGDPATFQYLYQKHVN